MTAITFSEAPKYRLDAAYSRGVAIYPDRPVSSCYVSLRVGGQLMIDAGYSWDGPSGPAIDTSNFMEASLVHDALYDLMRLKLLDKKHRAAADLELFKICRENGMSLFRASYIYLAVRLFGSRHIEL